MCFNHTEWSRESLLEAWMENPISCCEKSGVVPPGTLCDESAVSVEGSSSPHSATHSDLAPSRPVSAVGEPPPTANDVSFTLYLCKIRF